MPRCWERLWRCWCLRMFRRSIAKGLFQRKAAISSPCQSRATGKGPKSPNRSTTRAQKNPPPHPRRCQQPLRSKNRSRRCQNRSSRSQNRSFRPRRNPLAMQARISGPAPFRPGTSRLQATRLSCPHPCRNLLHLRMFRWKCRWRLNRLFLSMARALL